MSWLGLVRYWWVAALLVLLALGIGLATRTEPAKLAAGPALSAGAAAPTSPVRRETRPTLDPARFVGKAALTHQIARDIPDVLDQLYCYCECDKHVGHKSLLSCYTDGHAAT